MLSLAALALTAAGCANSTHMFLVQETQVGLVGSANLQNSNLKVAVGYGRKTLTLIPKVNRNLTAGGEQDIDAGSVFVASRAEFNGLEIPVIDELIATGAAADNLGALNESKTVFTGKTQP